MKRKAPEVNLELKRHLFYETSHSPSLVELVGYEKARQIVDFCFIANPYYPTEAMMRHMQDYLPALIKSYPSSDPSHSRRFIAEVMHINPDDLLIGNGASELITVICERIIQNIAIPIPTFSEYIDKLDPRQAALYPLSRGEDYRLDLEAFLLWIRKRGFHAALIVNPGNPTGQFFDLPAMEAFLEQAKKLDLVIVDESFIDFAGDPIPTLLHAAEKYSNLVVVRSMSKHCGIPGLRLGYCYAHNRYLLNQIARALPAWNINAVAEYFLSLLPSTDAEFHEARLRLQEDVSWLYEALRQVEGFHPYPTGANFVLIRVENGLTAAQVQEALLQRGLYVRDCSNKRGMDHYHIRVASQGREKDALLVEALKQIAREEAAS